MEENLPLEINNGALENNFIVFDLNFFVVNVGFINVLLNSDKCETAALNNYLETLSKLDYYLDALHFLIGDLMLSFFMVELGRVCLTLLREIALVLLCLS